MVSEDDKGTKHVSFVSSKSRIAPLGGQTIPRMELLGALILSRLIVKIKEALQGFVEVSDVLCLTDSTVRAGGSRIQRRSTNSSSRNESKK